MTKSAIVNEGIKANIVDSTGGGKISDNYISAKIADVIIIETGNGGGEELVTVIPFTNADLVNGQLIRLHGLNRRVVSVTITNQDGLEFEPSINNLNDNTRVLIDLQRYNITGTWYLTIR
ncbi:MAG: hypothetical protein HC907_17820 [Richelia sp. SM1_7_0]|nr:hypothetical protein [Richelia sp. SM1_7_0]